MATHCGILAWEIPWTLEPGGLQCMESQELDMTEQLTLSCLGEQCFIDQILLSNLLKNKFPGFQRASQPLFCVILYEYQPCETYTAVRFTRLELLFHLLQEGKLTLRNPLERLQVSGRVKIGLIPCLS